MCLSLLKNIKIIQLTALTTMLWMKFVEIKKLNTSIKHLIPILNIELEAQTAYLVYSILATIFTVIYLILYFLFKEVNLNFNFKRLF